MSPNLSSCKLTQDFYELFCEQGFLSLIAKPTRVSRNTATVIDHIYTNSIQKNLSCGVLVTDLTDHFPVFCISHTSDPSDPDLITSFTRRFNNKNLQHFQNSLSQLDWSVVYSSTDTNTIAQIFLDSFQKLFQKCFPLTKITSNSTQKPWLTNGIKRASTKKPNYTLNFSRKKP